MSHVFLSYAREDLEVAKRLARALEAQGFAVWWDRTIPPGKTFDQVIEEALADAEKVVVLWSARSVASNWVRAEADEALERGILVPVLIEDVLPPFSSRRIEAAELQRWTGDPNDPELQNLMAALRGTGVIKVKPPAMPDPEPRRSEPAPHPVPPPKRAGRGLALALGALAALLVVGVGLVVVVAIALGRPEPAPWPPEPDPVDDPGETVFDGGDDPGDPYAEKLAVEPADAPAAAGLAPPPPPRSATVTLRYSGDAYACTLDLALEVGPHRFVPTSNVYILYDLPEGPTAYSIGGAIACPTLGACTVQGAGTLDVRDGAVYDLVWQNTGYGQCQATLIDAVQF
jgi:hypothetical protein